MKSSNFHKLDYRADLALNDHLYVVDHARDHKTTALSSETVIEILARYLPGEQITFSKTHRGKPMLRDVTDANLHIALSHSANFLAMAVSQDADLGVDIEMIRERKFIKQISARYFAAPPKDLLSFYRAWTAREAFIKAIGSTLGQSLAQIITKEDGDEILIGIKPTLTHHVSFFMFGEKILVACARVTDKKIRVMSCPA